MPLDPPRDGPDVIPSPLDPDVECVRIGSQAHGEGDAQPPPGGAPEATAEELESPCPEGYVPRRRRRPPYDLDGKVVRPGGSEEGDRDDGNG